MKIRIKDPDRTRKVIDVTVSGNLVERFTDAMDELDDVLVNRTEEIEALKLCFITSSHMMIEGRHGIAKSMLADEAFRRITGASIFKKQFMKGTQTDEVLGPMNSKRYREDAVWEHNTTGMLPTCHFFFGDEIYRASDQCLPLMMGILNEGEFINGGIVTRCPLITAIGTTNFVTDSEELEAFHDRWQVHVKAEPLSSASDVRQMLGRALKDRIKKPKTISLEEIRALNSGAREVKLSEDILDLLPEVFQKFAQAIGNAFISDRRKVQSLRFMQAAALLDNKSEVEPDHIEGCRFIMTSLREKAHGQAWASVVATTLGEFTQAKAENRDLRKLENLTKMLEGNFDPDMPERDMKKIWDQSKNTLAAVNNARPDQCPKSHQGISRMDTVKRKLEELCQSISLKAVF